MCLIKKLGGTRDRSVWVAPYLRSFSTQLLPSALGVPGGREPLVSCELSTTHCSALTK